MKIPSSYSRRRIRLPVRGAVRATDVKQLPHDNDRRPKKRKERR